MLAHIPHELVLGCWLVVEVMLLPVLHLVGLHEHAVYVRCCWLVHTDSALPLSLSSTCTIGTL